MTALAKSECGNYGEDTLTVQRVSDCVVIERAGKDGSVRSWRVEASDTVRVSSRGWGSGGIVGVESELELVRADGEAIAITHFEFSSPWGGPSDDDVAKLAEAIGSAAGCRVVIVPMSVPEHWKQKSEPAPVSSTPSVSSAPSAPIEPPVAPQRKPLLADAAGTEVLATIVCDKTNVPLRALRVADGGVCIENAATGVYWPIVRDDVLWIRPYAMLHEKGVWTVLERATGQATERIAEFYCYEDERKGPDDEAVAAFLAPVVGATGCTVHRHALVWD